MALKDGSAENYAEAAVRHYTDAEYLRAGGRLDNAGHLIGFAAECAIKHRIGTISPSSQSPNMHLPDILPAARKHLGTRTSFTGMYNILKASIFANWAVDHRYASDGKVTPEIYQDWLSVTKRLFAAAGLKCTKQ